MVGLVLPGAEDRTVVIGQTGSGKTILAGYLLSRQNFNARPWVALDFKREPLWQEVGDPPMRDLRLGAMPPKKGLYRMEVNPGDEDALEDWLWAIWKRENVGIFVDEVSLVPQRRAFKAIQRQGRSKLIPVISCTQRPVDCDREVFSEAQYRCCLSLEDDRDYAVVRGLFGRSDIRPMLDRLPRHASLWWDVRTRTLHLLKPCPPPATVASDLRAALPKPTWFMGG